MVEFMCVPGFSKLWLMQPASEAIHIRRLLFRGDAWDVMVVPSGFIKGVPNCIMLWVSRINADKISASRINVSIEILDTTWERTVFHYEREAGGSGTVKRSDLEVTSFLTVKRSELEVTSCVHNDSIPVRCTLTCIDMKKQDQNAAGRSSKWWRLIRRSLYAPLKIRDSKLSEEASMMRTTDDVIPDRRSTIHHLITIPGYSKLAQIPTASSLTLRLFRFLGHSWSIKLFPNGTHETSADCISIMVMRHSDSDTDSRIDIAIEILDKSHKHALFYKKKVIGDDDLSFRSTLMVNKTELEAAACLHEDSFTITCTLTLRDTKQQQQDNEKIRTTPRTTDQSDSVRTPLLGYHKLLIF
jgi:hypothetical protein